MISLSRDQIAALLDIRSLAPCIEATYRASSAREINLPQVGHIELPERNDDSHIKFGQRRGDPSFVIKVATGFPDTPSEIGRTSNGLSLVLSAHTGEVQAMLHDEMLLTDVRTAIGSAIATRALTHPDATRLLIVGTGAQAEHQIQAHRELLNRPLEISVWGRSPEKAKAVAERNNTQHASVLAAACATADIIVTVTAASKPLIMNDWIAPGTHITAVGADAPGKHELDAALIERADHLVADSPHQCLHHGDLSILSSERHQDVVQLGTVLDSGLTRSHEAVTIVDLTGTAAQEIAIAQWILDARSAE